MSAEARRPGMDQPYYDWSAITARPSFAWADGRTLALSVVVLLEHAELHPPEGSVQAPLPGGVMGSGFPFPNAPFFTHREYGLRVGIFRVLDVLAKHGMVPAVAIDAATCERTPFLVDHCRGRGVEFVAHGLSASQIVSSRMDEPHERDYLRAALGKIRTATGGDLRGWYGPEQSESERTPRLLDEAGLDYVLDWPNDEQPFRMKTPRSLLSVPTQYALDDAYFLLSRAGTTDEYVECVGRAAERLASDGAASARSLILVVRPWLIGQPFRIEAFDRAIARVTADPRCWPTTPGGMADAFRSLVPGRGRPSPF